MLQVENALCTAAPCVTTVTVACNAGQAAVGCGSFINSGTLTCNDGSVAVLDTFFSGATTATAHTCVVRAFRAAGGACSTGTIGVRAQVKCINVP
jgi:hypothetical protein